MSHQSGFVVIVVDDKVWGSRKRLLGSRFTFGTLSESSFDRLYRL
jgi:hypothetical protein